MANAEEGTVEGEILEGMKLAPIICERCGIVSLLDHSTVRKLTQPEYVAIQISPAWAFIEQVQEIIKNGPVAAAR